MNKNRYFYAAPYLAHQAKLFVLSTDNHLYCEYNHENDPAIYSVQVDQETFVAADFKWADEQAVIEVDYASAVATAQQYQQHWFDNYLAQQLRYEECE
ncbi:hypothetical protein [Pseudoalteromonas ulvae]|uniref:Uncharacterized protein n=1 Tax=Pseudoalteromonas ulvae TaxID=107327 RepID=A0A244CLH6_PSEDV|nr:hypothetical protein [Pseudoalteromonas ulvae]OUL56444.1 hypothetical protein B1199_17415 [Pseudoalteromonas ulvae]